MEEYTRRQFLRKTGYAVAGLGLLANSAEANTETEKTMSEKIEDSRQRYLKIFKKIEQQRNYLIARIKEAAERMKITTIPIRGKEATYSTDLRMNFIQHAPTRKLRKIWSVLSGEYTGYLMEIAENINP